MTQVEWTPAQLASGLNNQSSVLKPVLAEGPTKCLIAIVGEAPGETEELLGRPFIGTAGNILNQKLHMSHILRSECYVTNLVKLRPNRLHQMGQTFKPPKTENDFSVFWRGENPHPYLLNARQGLLDELSQLETNVIVALGNSALWALTGKHSIGKWRGTVHQISLPGGRSIKVIGSYHPAAVAREWTLGSVLQIDLKRAKEQALLGDTFTTPTRHLYIKPTMEECFRYADQFLYNAPAISFDIETTPGGITCLGFAHSAQQGISIPTTLGYWGSIENLNKIIRLCRRILSGTQTKIGQNITFDIQYLMRGFDILPKKPWVDTMIKQHACYPELPKSLAFLASVYTWEPYYKDDLKVWMGGQSSNELLWQYNARDCCVTFEVNEALDKEINELGVRHIYDFYMELLEPLLYMMLRGVKVDMEKMSEYRKLYSERLDSKVAAFQNEYGAVNPFSPKQVGELAYGKLGLDPVKVKGKITTNKKAIEKLAVKSEGLNAVAEIRSEKTIISNYLEMSLDSVDGRLRCSFNSTGTETRRLSSSESVFGSGRNLQNLPKKIRDIIIADEGKEIDAADLSGAESMVVAYCSNDLHGIKMFEERKSIHIFTACQIFQCSPEEIVADKLKCAKEGRENQSKYFIAKKLRHSSEKSGTWVTVSEQLKCSPAEAKRYLQMFYRFNPNLLKWFMEVEAQLKKDRTIITPVGGKRVFLGRFGPELVREAVAFIAQDVVAFVINSGIVRFYREVCQGMPEVGAEVLLQVHDEIILQRNTEYRGLVHSKLHELFRTDLTINNRTFYIPLEIKTGKDWKNVE